MQSEFWQLLNSWLMYSWSFQITYDILCAFSAMIILLLSDFFFKVRMYSICIHLYVFYMHLMGLTYKAGYRFIHKLLDRVFMQTKLVFMKIMRIRK